MQLSQKLNISAVVICCNEEQKIARCLKSLAFCDEILVVDSGSTDNTLAIAKPLATKMMHQDWLGFVQQKQFALDHCKHEWALSVDADEVVTPELAEEITAVLKRDSSREIHAYELNRVVYFLGKFWRKGGWYPEYRVRLVRRSKARWGGRNPHDKLLVEGRPLRLKGELLHFTYENFSAQVRSLNSFSSIAAEERVKDGARASLLNIIVNPCARFIKFYFIRKGYREGLSGFLVALVEAFAVFLKYAKIAELRHYSNGAETHEMDSSSKVRPSTSPPEHTSTSRAEAAHTVHID